MDGLICRYGASAKRRDTFLCVIGSIAGGAAAAMAIGRGDAEPFMAGRGVCFLASRFSVIRRRWRRWVGADGRGLVAGSAAGDPVQRLGWEEMEEIVLFRGGGFDIRGADATIRAVNDLEAVSGLRDVLLRNRAPS